MRKALVRYRRPAPHVIDPTHQIAQRQLSLTAHCVEVYSLILKETTGNPHPESAQCSHCDHLWPASLCFCFSLLFAALPAPAALVTPARTYVVAAIRASRPLKSKPLWPKPGMEQRRHRWAWIFRLETRKETTQGRYTRSIASQAVLNTPA